jgi:demethylmenaquinone methyltransferase/2-methoxy-6-polyprenyl-1,4-benzoquinol methylase
MPVADEQGVRSPAKEPARIAGMFDAIARRYDFLNHFLSAGLDRKWRARAVDALGLHGHETVLDLCTGTADLALEAVGRPVGARRVVGVDFSGAMLAIAKNKVRKPGALGPAGSSVALLRGDATRIPLHDEAVDAVTIGFGIRNVEKPAQACQEIVRVLRPGGTLVILEFSLPQSRIVRQVYLWYFRRMLPWFGRVISRHPTAYTYFIESVGAFPSPAQFAQDLRAAGFSSVRTVPLTFGIVYLFVATKERSPIQFRGLPSA